jgi:diguanylate cyclase (GGDEF)-like protein
MKPGVTPGAALTPSWVPWVLSNAQIGLLLVDQQGSVVYCNAWICKHAHMHADQIQGHPLAQVFPSIKNTYFENALNRALKAGFSAFLSNSLHPSPFPLFPPKSRRESEHLIKQSIHILPMGVQDSQQAGQRLVLVQINDMTQAVKRERLMKAQALALHDVARMDSLTRIGNRRHFDEVLKQEFRQAVRSNSPLSLILVDLDHFKEFNDTYGHVKGDQALVLTAQALASSCHRPRDLAARYGGEELVLILPDTDLDGASKVALELQGKMLKLNIPHFHNEPLKTLTLSVGVASVDAAELQSATELVEMADAALYRAKNQGRNCICLQDGVEIGTLPCSNE